jgi:hypothetical protein
VKKYNYIPILIFSVLITSFVASPIHSAEIGEVLGEQKISDLEGGLVEDLDSLDYFGRSVTNIGDLDNDGVEDIAVGAHGTDNEDDEGAVYILFLNKDGTVKGEQKIADGVGGLSANLDPNDFFGRSVEGIGDLNNDGIEDIAVGSSDDDDGDSGAGAIYILFLNTNGTVKSEQKISQTTGGMVNLDAFDSFGYSITNIGDLDEDGVTDLAVGARKDGDGGSYAGAVYILFMNTNGTADSVQKISDLEGGLTEDLEGSDYFGSSVTNLGDVNDDDITDIAVGATGDDDGDSTAGAIYILFLDTDGTVKGEQKISDLSGNLTEDLGASDEFGFSVEGIGDLNSDGTPDLAVGAVGDDVSLNEGAVYILFLNATGTVKDEVKIGEGQGGLTADLNNSAEFGSSITNLNDLDEDGYTDIAVGVYQDNDGGTAAGAVFVLNLQGVDATGPTGSININSGDTHTSSTSVTLTISATDTQTGVDQMIICNNDAFTDCTWESYDTSKAWTLDSTDGLKTVYIKFKDVATNESSIYTDTITLDTTGPTGSININSGATYTTNPIVTISISSSDVTSSVTHMMLCNSSDFSGCIWQTVDTTKSWVLSSGDGNKTVYIKLKDEVGNISSVYTDNIKLDTTKPTGSININSGSSSTTTTSVTLSISSTDTTSGIYQMMLCNNSSFSGCSWESYSTSKSWTLTSGDGVKTVYVKFKDNAGLISNTYNDTILLSTPEPTPTYIPPVVEEEEEEQEETVKEDSEITEEEIEEVKEILEEITEEGEEINQEEGVKIKVGESEVDTKGKETVHFYEDSGLELAIPVTTLTEEDPEDIDRVYAVLGESVVKLTLNSVGDQYIGEIVARDVVGEQEIDILAMFKDNTTKKAVLSISIDPYGYVYSLNKDGNQVRIKDAIVSLYVVENGKESLYTVTGQDNPQNTDEEGQYSFMVEPGTYILKVTADGYKDYNSKEIEVEKTIVEFNIELEEKFDIWNYWLYMVLLMAIIPVLYSFVKKK